jgi:type IV pilus assembly protein PilN
MILINLLPHRETARKKRKEQFMMAGAGAALLGAMLAGVIHFWIQSQVDAQMARNTYLASETTKLVEQIKDIAGLRAEIQSLKARQEAVENLQSDRNTPVYLLNELVTQIPEGIYLQSMKQEGSVVQFVGVAQSQERVSELLRNLSSRSKYLTKPELVEIVTAMQSFSSRDQRRVANFTIKAQLIRPTTETSAISASR